MSEYIEEKIKNDDLAIEEKPKRGFSETYELADFGTRLKAIFIDTLILGVIGAIVGIGSNSGLGAVTTWVIAIAYHWYFLTQQNGQTIGKNICGIRVVKANGKPLELTDVVIRYVGYHINSFVFGLGWLWAMWDDKSQGWHDKMANTYVVKV
jgi:uncharacterized RDD family membrane protein YckC